VPNTNFFQRQLLVDTSFSPRGNETRAHKEALMIY